MATLPSPEVALAGYDRLLEMIARRPRTEAEVRPSLFSAVGVNLYNFGITTYRAVGLLLHGRHHGQATALFRTLWETAANFEWVRRDPDRRAAQFLGYAAVEMRRYLETSPRFPSAVERQAALVGFDAGFGSFIQTFRQRQGTRSRWFNRFTGFGLQEPIRDLGPPWTSEYSTIYKLACQYTHGSPAAILSTVRRQV